MSTCNQLDLQTLGSQPIMPKNLPNHCQQDPNKFSVGLGRILTDYAQKSSPDIAPKDITS